MNIENYKPTRKTYYVSPANSLGFMDEGIDISLSRIVFPGIEPKLKKRIDKYCEFNLLGTKFTSTTKFISKY
jgi:hypothetical protein